MTYLTEPKTLICKQLDSRNNSFLELCRNFSNYNRVIKSSHNLVFLLMQSWKHWFQDFWKKSEIKWQAIRETKMFLNWSLMEMIGICYLPRQRDECLLWKNHLRDECFAMKEAFLTIIKVVVNVSISKYPYTTFLLKFFNLLHYGFYYFFLSENWRIHNSFVSFATGSKALLLSSLLNCILNSFFRIPGKDCFW